MCVAAGWTFMVSPRFFFQSIFPFISPLGCPIFPSSAPNWSQPPWTPCTCGERSEKDRRGRCGQGDIILCGNPLFCSDVTCRQLAAIAAQVLATPIDNWQHCTLHSVLHLAHTCIQHFSTSYSLPLYFLLCIAHSGFSFYALFHPFFLPHQLTIEPGKNKDESVDFFQGIHTGERHQAVIGRRELKDSDTQSEFNVVYPKITYSYDTNQVDQ